MPETRFAVLPVDTLSAIQEDRDAVYAELHDEIDLFQIEGRRSLVVLAHHLVVSGLKNRSFRSNKREAFFRTLAHHGIQDAARAALERVYDGWLMYMDPPEHPKYRTEVAEALQASRTHPGQEASELVSQAFATGEPQSITSTVSPAWLRSAMASIMGCSVVEYERMVELSKTLLEFFIGRTQIEEKDIGATLGAYRELGELLLAQQGRNGLVPLLLESLSADDPRRIPVIVSLIADTWEPVLALMTSGVFHGLSKQSGETLCDSAPSLEYLFQESSRYDTPFQLCNRVAEAGATLDAVDCQGGDRVLFVIGAANRDPRIFEEPREFRLERGARSKQVSFGHGPHYCLGARLAYDLCCTFWNDLREGMGKRRYGVASHRWRDVLGMRILDELVIVPVT